MKTNTILLTGIIIILFIIIIKCNANSERLEHKLHIKNIHPIDINRPIG